MFDLHRNAFQYILNKKIDVTNKCPQLDIYLCNLL